MDKMAQRTRRAAERILEDERLTDNLTDDAAKVLIDWGISSAESIARTTEDDQTMQDQLQAVRRLMRYVNMWVPRREDMSAEESSSILTKIMEQAAVIYGVEASDVPREQRQTRADQLTTQAALPPAQFIETLRTFIETQHSQTEHSEERYGQEIYF